ncbi:meiotic nuclear division protein 1 homolog [Lucilia sericata]|uniref:meiotic nuclear division protein 1 homolog n=1 Tax=Lucilia sericata TaxID=13632 RepID=UPI0018A80EE7|nr:meiotic nuclear division protein 1 homolog [Lucilia sericata]
MSKRKALTADEKQVKLLELFHETNDVYQLKDLERLAPQEKGIVMQSVKTTLQELVDNGLVQSEKISGSLYYWSFPSENIKRLEKQINDVESKTLKIEQRLQTTQSQLKNAEDALEDLTTVEVITREIAVLKEEKETLEKQLQQFQHEVDYEELKAKECDTKKLLEAANRWTDNVFMTKSWCKRKFDKQDRELNKAFGIPEELDYVDV